MLLPLSRPAWATVGSTAVAARRPERPMYLVGWGGGPGVTACTRIDTIGPIV